MADPRPFLGVSDWNRICRTAGTAVSNWWARPDSGNCISISPETVAIALHRGLLPEDLAMLTTRHAVGFTYAHAERKALFRVAHAQDVERGARHDARATAILV